METEIYVISCERFETLCLCLAGLLGHNQGVGSIHLIDDHSEDPRIEKMILEYLDTGLLATYERMPHRSGIGVVRRRVIDRFLAGTAQELVQIEGDVLLPPGGLAQLASAYRELHEIHVPGLLPTDHPYGPVTRVNWLCAYRHDWVHQTIGPVWERADYRFSMARDGSEPFWSTSRDVLFPNQVWCPATRPDLRLFLPRVGAAVLLSPEIQCQHVGAINSFYYPQFDPGLVSYFNADTSLRQPFPKLFQLDFTLPRDVYPELYMEYAARVREESVVDVR